jgi:hypothetical protein
MAMTLLIAYVDPGSGTLLVQGLIAAVCGGGLFLGRRCLGWAAALWRRRSPARPARE